ncbi:MAG: hypothetical protein ACTHJM_05175 [Marmoricola sp.]
MLTGLWIVIGAFVLVALVSAVVAVTRKGDEEEHDIEHLDHQIHGDA